MPAALDRNKVREHLKNFDLRALFVEELGWDQGGSDVEARISDSTFLLKAVAHKRGMVAYQYVADGIFPDHPTRQKIEKAVAKTVREHLIVYSTHDGSAQYWQWIKREPGKPDRSRVHIYHRDQLGEALIQKLEHIAFTLDEEDDLTIVDVSGRIRAAFDVEKVTKRFYDRFRKEHDVFLDFIDGIESLADREWYASLMLNRMMFIYFIQKRGFLDGDVDYLRTRLGRMQVEHGKDRFQTFYRLFLLRLFHEGLSRPVDDRDPELVTLLGRIPYLNGGLFEVHDLERGKQPIHIPDVAFQRIFDFFDAYQWHLDDRPLRADTEINPDVLGYIFEKYINQKQLGAYYTKEDITGYISRTTVIPFLFDQAQKECPIAFEPAGGIWRLLSDDPDRYIFDSVRHGISHDIRERQDLTQRRELPPNIAVGLEDVSKRDKWNTVAPADYGLPTETWREHIARRQRYDDVHARLAGGEIVSVNDLITYNLDLEKFTQDVIAGSEGPELVRAFWRAISEISILDPTCGSGAFLFAALNILEPIYVTCLEAMQGFLDDLKRTGRRHHPDAMRDFREVLDGVADHASERYFILKSIIVSNLYGVDLMKEAAEICKLRLFLKLVAQLDSYHQIEPLPDIDFNIRAGNTVVGFASLDHVKRALDRDLLQQLSLPSLTNRADMVDEAFRLFRQAQTERLVDATTLVDAKTALRDGLNDLRSDLDAYLATEYAIAVDEPGPYSTWRETHQPFHWFVEFHEIMRNGGFDVIIGNPPYIAATKVRRVYNVRDFDCSGCPDIYAWILERTQNLLRHGGRTGMIVPLSIGFSGGFDTCRKLLFQGYSSNWFSSFGRIPSALFSFDVRVRNTIHLGHKGTGTSLHHTTRLHRWFDIARPYLFDQLQYTFFEPELWESRIPKLNSPTVSGAFAKLFRSTSIRLGTQTAARPTGHVLYFKKTAYNWLNFCRTQPPCYDSQGNAVPHTKFGRVYFPDKQSLELAMLLANGKLMLAYWFAVADDFDVTRWNFADFPIDFRRLKPSHRERLLDLTSELERAMHENTQFKLNAGKRVGNYNLAMCRRITDRSDAIFLDALDIVDAWEDVELYCAQAVRTDFSSGEEFA